MLIKTGGNKLQTTAAKSDELKVDAIKPAQSIVPAPTLDMKNDTECLSPQSALAALQSDVQPVGHDYVEEVPEILVDNSKANVIFILGCCCQYTYNTNLFFTGKE